MAPRDKIGEGVVR